LAAVVHVEIGIDAWFMRAARRRRSSAVAVHRSSGVTRYVAIPWLLLSSVRATLSPYRTEGAMGRQRFPWPVSARHERLVRTAEEFANEQIIPAADRADECREFRSDLQDAFLATGLPREFLDPQP